MALPVMKPDRRRVSRTNLTGLAYINFEPDNGGIVLNISEEGLSFHSVAAVQRGVTTLPFSLSANGNSIEAVGLLSWTDEHRKTGGLRFSGLAPDARRQIRTLIDQSSRPFAPEKNLAAPRAGRERTSGRLSGQAPASASALTNSLLRWVRAPLRWSDFSRGLAAGLLIALFVATGFSLDARRRQIGGFLIRLGERLEAAPRHEAAPSVASSPAPSKTSPSATASRRVTSLATGAAAADRASTSSARTDENLPARPAIEAQPDARLKPAAATPVVPPPTLPWPSAAPSFAAPWTAARDASQAAAGPEPVSPAAPAHLSDSPSVLAKAADQPGEEDAEDIAEINSGMPLGKYFDVGKFKDEFVASQIERNLTALGFRTAILPKSLLWMKSYQVLVGPYRNTQDAEGARRDLQSRGYEPRSLAQRSRRLILGNPNDLFETDSDVLVVTWETYGAQATVKFIRKGENSGAAVGKWVKLAGPSEDSAIVYTTGSPGKRTLLSIEFRGMKQAVMLPNSAGQGIVF